MKTCSLSRIFMSIVHYFAYGSNLHPLRLQRRIPSAQLLGTATISGYKLSFAKRGQDASGKGHIKPASHGEVFGAVYQLDSEHKTNLDHFEGPGYGRTSFEVSVNRQAYSCFAYVGLPTHLDESLQPFHWYKSLIMLGAEFHGFPASYIRNIQQTPSIADSDPHRSRLNERLIADIKNYDMTT
jgi:gamma-glutamylcyclotransferase (GGCT)/AIG2-like uncharacterized protein YtfP